jgi:hypothetical protein
MAIERPSWGAPAAGAGIGGRETPGDVPARPEPASEAKPAEAVEAPRAAPAVVDARALDAIDPEDQATYRRLIADGLFSPEEVQNVYMLSDSEMEALQQPARGKASIERELEKIARVMREDRPRYEREFAGRYRELLEAKEQQKANQAKGGGAKAASNEPADVSGLPPEVVADWSKAGGLEHHLKVAQGTASLAFDALDDQEAATFQQGFDQLPAPIQAAVYQGISVEPGFAKSASDAAVTEFAAIGTECADLVASWGSKASSRLGVAQSRVATILKGLPASERQAAMAWMDSMPASQQAAVVRSLAGKGR